jgi:CHAD domain-containing protein
MAYRFKKNEAIPRAIRRVFAEEISWAVGQLKNARKKAEAVHEARKSVKKIRGLMGLIRTRLGPLHKAEDRHLRDAGRRLSALRDTAVMLEVFDALAAKQAATDGGEHTEIRRNLERKRSETPPEKRVRAEVVRLFNEARPKAASWPLDDLDVGALLPDLTAVYRKGRKALKHAQKTESMVVLHDFRKAVKQHWYHMRLLEGVCGGNVKERAGELRDLETWLGDANNLAVLRERIVAEAETSRDRQQIRQFLALIDEEARDLRKRALEAGERLYAAKGREFGETLSLPSASTRKGPSAAPAAARVAAA